MEAPQPDHTDAVSGFHVWLNHARLENKVVVKDFESEKEISGFIPKSEVSKYLTHWRIRNILKELFPDVPPPEDYEVADHRLLEFCVLLSIGEGKLIQQLVKKTADSDLKDVFRPDVWQKYRKAQWEFMVEDLQWHGLREYSEEHSLPYIRKELVAKGSTSNLWRVVVHRDYDKLLPLSKDPERPHNHYALKEYTSYRREDHYKKETDNFRKLCRKEKKCPLGLVEYLGAYQHGDKCHMLLEFADGGTLAEVLATEQPPMDGDEILRFWEQKLRLLDALTRIHQLENSSVDEDGKPVKYLGSHQDIQPANIVTHPIEVPSDTESASGYKARQFKLADLGLGKFVKDTGKSIDTGMIDAQGGRSYRSPEAYRADPFDAQSRIYVTSRTDVFSLGCVLLVVAVWIIWGPQEVLRFHEQRKNENIGAGSRDNYKFHNGDYEDPEILQCVRDRLVKMPRGIRAGDYTTGKVLELIEKMIEPDVDARYTAAIARKEAQRLLDKARTDLENDRKYIKLPNSAREKSKTTPPTTQPYGGLPGPQVWNRDPSSSVASSSNHEWQPLSSRLPPSTGYTSGETIYQDGRTSRSDRNVPTLALKVPRENGTIVSKIAAKNESDTSPLYDEPGDIDYIDNEANHVNETVSRSTGSAKKKPVSPITPTRNVALPGSDADPAVSESKTPVPPTKGAVVIPVQVPSKAVPAPPTPVKKTPQKLLQSLKVSEVLAWKNKRKGVSGRLRRLSSDSQLRDWHVVKPRLKDRDHIFLIDNATTMSHDWFHVIDTFSALAYLVKDCDPDGVDLYYTNHNQTWRSATASELIEHVQQYEPKPNSKIETDMGMALRRILNARQELIRRDGLPRPASIYVFTDGIWARGTNAEAPIMETVHLIQSHNLKLRCVGIQFISFGESEEGLQRMVALDDMHLRDDVPLDIVDTEPFSGDVWKMLLGPVDNHMDHTQDNG